MVNPVPTLSWNPKTGYSCTGCKWARHVHIGPQLPHEDDIAQLVREEFASHLREHHGDPENTPQLSRFAVFSAQS